MFKKYILFYLNFIVSLYQGLILSYGYLGKQVVLANINNIEELKIPIDIFRNYINELNKLNFLLIFLTYAVTVFSVQCFSIAIYNETKTLKSRRITAFSIWIAPAIIGLPTVILTAFYILSPLYAVSTIPAFLSTFNEVPYNKEDFMEGIVFSVAVAG